MADDSLRAELPVITKHGVLYRNSYYSVSHVRATFRDRLKDYYVVDHGTRVGVVITRDDHILLVRQYRLLINGISWELPGGGMGSSETPREAAVRECLEETGILCRGLTPLLRYHAGLDIMHNEIHLFHTSVFETVANSSPNDPQEQVTSEWVPSNTILDMIRDGRIADSFTISGLLLYRSLVA